MNVLREIREVNSDIIEIKVPEEFKEKKLEIIVFPLEEADRKFTTRKKRNLTIYKCYGKKKNFSRDDAYYDRI